MSPALPNGDSTSGVSHDSRLGSGNEPTGAEPTAARSPSEESRDHEPAPLIPGYEILGFIGSGGQGDVYRARHLGLDRPVALKILRDSQGGSADLQARFRREGRVIARLDHPGIVRVYGFDECGGRFFFSMEYLAGGSLKDRLASRESLPPQAAVDLLLTLIPAIEHAHDKGIVHRDLKPANVLFSEDGAAKIVDFGLAKVLAEDASHQTRTGAVLGSPSYMAPEQAAGKTSHVGPATDVYALGAILYELLAGRPPFSGESWLETLDKVRFDRVPPPSRWRPGLPPELERICLQCLEKAPDLRYPSARALGQALRRFAGITESDSAPEPSPLPAPTAAGTAPETIDESFPRGAAVAGEFREAPPVKGKQVGAEHQEGYRLMRRIRAGAAGEVWNAVAPGGIQAAVKIFYQAAEEHNQQRRALDLVKNLNHPYLLKIQAYWVEDSRLHVAMELADYSLRDELRGCQRKGLTGVPAAKLLAHVEEAAEALDYLHGRGLLHRNITPDNVLVLKGHVKIGDFSLVCQGRDPSDSRSSAPGYLAPECYRGSATRASDQYSLAISYVELRRGRRPFPARTDLAGALMDALESAPDLGDLDKPEKTVLLRALAKDPLQRYASCRELAAALSATVEDD
jgi:serine/threonine protein kinase